ncbi:hypothetical protein GWI33_016660 [Rhynchophorus ferrugineus]|uniref:Uncharacterized protein n=1 Tax=Rhynchophorus ferrugineus TaxID=354439 RepID=A0A834I360_RHYFE|nr:hypothetical protein GWI33_016660 [Rhynchophorus ferrugineus]
MLGFREDEELLYVQENQALDSLESFRATPLHSERRSPTTENLLCQILIFSFVPHHSGIDGIGQVLIRNEKYRKSSTNQSFHGGVGKSVDSHFLLNLRLL